MPARERSAAFRTPLPGVRPEIQALRALAVLGVLIFHLWPLRLAGGYVGVDVFFVVSGFLITDHLLRELHRDGRISVAGFWARRARRLLPASLLVLSVTAVGVFLWVPLTRWSQFGWEIIASAFYVENWALAAQSVDYMALSNAKSPVQHFWTLGVEEQFYIVWPLLIMAGVGIARLAARRSGARSGVLAVVAVATAASFVYSIVGTALTPSIAYFSTGARAWEFGAGALLALLLRRAPRPLSDRAAAAASWIGFGMVAAAMLLFTGATPFPSYTAALPVLGTALAIIAGSPSVNWAPTRLVSLRPVQFVGDVSYGVYLWHWPLIVIVPFATGHALTTVECLLLLGASLLLGWASKRFIEDPVRTHRWIAAARPRRSLLATAAAMAAVSAIALPLAVSTVPPAPEIPAQPASCWGAEAMLDPAACGPPDQVALEAPVVSFAADLPPESVRDCEVTVESATYRRCDLIAGDTPRTVALVGDSHATRWVETFTRAAQANGWGLSSFLVSGCPLVTRDQIGSAWGYDPVGSQLCPVPTDGVLREIADDPTITDVVLTNRTRLYVSDDPANRPLTAAQVEPALRELQAAGKHVVVLKDPPEVHPVPVKGAAGAIDCLVAAGASSACTMPRDQADFADPMTTAAISADAPVLDLTDLFCDEQRCYQQIGGLVVYTDDNHLTRSFAASLSGVLADRLRQTVG